jgi:septal ring factor EnvC (AmiA/AmiB activator)
MSLALRIFIVLVFVLTLAFMFVQMTLFATRENWKRRWDVDTKALAGELKQATQMITTKSADAVRSETQVAMLQKEVLDAQAVNKLKENEITEKSTTIGNLQRDIAKAQTDYNALKEDFGAQQNSLNLARTRNSELTSIAAVARGVAFNLNVKLAEVEDDLNQKQTDYTRLAEDLSQKEDALKQGTAFIAQVREKFPKVYDALKDEKGSLASLRGVVAEVRHGTDGKPDFVLLSIGKEEGVEEGQEFIVYRGKDYLCRVRVEKVMNDAAPARVIPNTINTNGLQVQKGDLATNRL